MECRMKMSRSIVLVLLASAIASCSPDKATSSASGDKIVIRGSNTIGEELAPALISAYKKEHPNVTFDLETKGSSYGFGALMGGYCDIAGASRLPNKDELEVAQYHNVDLNDYVIGSYAVAVVVNEKNPITNLTRLQVRDIFTGLTRNWKEVGGPDAPIHLYIRDPVSGTYLGFKELAMDNNAYAADPKLFTTATNYTDILRSVAADPGGIGYSGVYATQTAKTKIIAIDGKTPTSLEVNSGQYPYRRTLHLFTNKRNERPLTMDFIYFVLSSKGQEVLAQLGDVPHS